ncbi:MAG: hypothetical protein J6K15_10990 [Lachnospiraceae bacterium]|nr:hypothetical protein [Lachnospiraceae bacterium]MBP3578627.1 hypothetical protein [Lachnospiraceae bacterium]
MLKKKTTALLAILLTAIALISVTTKAYGAEETNLNLEQEALRTMEMVAGGTLHMKIELSAKDGYIVNPTFTVSPENNAPLTFSNIKVSNANPYYSNNAIFMDDFSNVILEYDVKVDNFAKIGVYEYAISYKYDAEWYDEEDLAELPEPGKLLMNITVVNEKMAPQISVVSGSEVSCKAGDLISIQFKLKNEGELEALDTYVFADYYDYYEVLTPAYTPLNQKIGNMASGKEKTVELIYKVEEDAKTQRIRLPLDITYKLADGTNGTSANSYIYIFVEGKPEVTPTPTATPTPVPTEAPKNALLLLNSVKQSPSKPEAGEKLTVTFYLQNAGNADAKNVKVMATGLSSSGFEPVNSEPYQFINQIKAGKKQKVELTLRVGEDIPEGLNMLNVQYSYEVESSYGTSTEVENVTLYILDVQNPEESELTISRPKLMVSDFYTDVEEVKAGGVFDFTFEIMNTNDSIDAKNIKVTVSGASNAFSVTAGGNSFFVSEIKAQERAPITINLKASAAATTGAYPINIKIEYEYDGMVATATYSGEIVEEEILLQVKENLRPSVENVYVGSWDTPMLNQPTVMSFEFYNMGKSTLNNTYVTIEGDFMLSNGSNSYYIGNIAAGMPEYIEFDVVPLVEGDAVGKMIIHMEDSNGDEVTMEKEFTAYVMGEMMWEDPGYMDPGYMDPGYMDPSVPVDGTEAKKPIVPLWLFLCIQGAILVIVIPVVRSIRLAAYRRKIKQEDAI